MVYIHSAVFNGLKLKNLIVSYNLFLAVMTESGMTPSNLIFVKAGIPSNGISETELKILLENGTCITKEQAELLVRNLDHLYEACQRNRYVMPKRNSPIITIDYCHAVSIAGVM